LVESLQPKGKLFLHLYFAERDSLISGNIETAPMDLPGLVYSAYVGRNSDVFPHILFLYVPIGSRIADVTYGRGQFWTQVDTGLYRCYFTDLVDGIDARNLPYKTASLDAVVFDPPWLHSPGTAYRDPNWRYERSFRNNVTPKHPTLKGVEAVLDLYYAATREAWRCLKTKGILILKVGDQVCGGKQRLMHVDIVNELTRTGYTIEDQFIMVRSSRPGISRLKNCQQHSRKNYSFS
jgi:hypothetical protein